MADTSNLSKFLTDVAQAIRDKKGSDAMIPAKNFDTEIADITTGVDTSDATATSMDLPSGVTAYARGEKITGALNKYENIELMQAYGGYANQGSIVEIKSTPHVGNPDLYGEGTVVSIMVPKEENGLVAENIVEGVNIFGIEGTASAGTDTSDATATADDIVQGKSAYVNGSKIEGALQKGLLNNDLMMNGLMFSDTDVTLSYEFPETKVIESGDGFWPTVGFSEIANEQGITSDMIVEGNRILGIEGTGGGGVDTSDATATSSDIAIGKTAYVNGEKVEGTVEDVYAETRIDTPELIDDGERLIMGMTTKADMLYRGGIDIKLMANHYEVAETIGLTPDRLINTDEPVLGMHGDIQDFRYGNLNVETAYIEDYGDELNFITKPAIDSGYPGVAIAQETMINHIMPYDELTSLLNITPDKIVAGNTILGVEGIVSDNGIDTSDATATESDIVVGKTAYANGEKLEGSVTELVRGGARTYDIDTGTLTNRSNDLLYNMNAPYTALLRWDTSMSSVIPHSDIATAISLTADQIVAGNTVLGVSGTASQGIDTSDATAVAGDILEGKSAYVNGEKVTGTLLPSTCHWFETVDEMRASVNNRDNDTATVYKNKVIPTTPNTPIYKVIFPARVVFSEPITSNKYTEVNDLGLGLSNNLVRLSGNSFRFLISTHDEETSTTTDLVAITYSSDDGITYDRDSALGSYISSTQGDIEVNFDGKISLSENGSEYVGEFMKVRDLEFGGLYKYDAEAEDPDYIRLPYIASISSNYDGSTFSISYDSEQRTSREFHKKNLFNKIVSAINKLGLEAIPNSVYFALDKDDESIEYVFLLQPAVYGDTNVANLIYDENGFLSIGVNVYTYTSSTVHTIPLYKFDADKEELTLVRTLEYTGECTYGAKIFRLYDVPVCTIPIDIRISANDIIIADNSYAAYKIGETAKQASGEFSTHISTLSSRVGSYIPLSLGDNYATPEELGGTTSEVNTVLDNIIGEEV